MSVRKSEVIFRRPKAGYEDFDPEHWEDSAISDAYDQAVKKDKDGKLNVFLPVSDNKQPEPSQAPKAINITTTSKLKKSGSRTTKQNVQVKKTTEQSTEADTATAAIKENSAVENGTEWAVGDTCVALYYEDGLYYDCRIKSINSANSTCTVEYTGYGNEETVEITDLHSPDKWKRETYLKTKETESSGEMSNWSNKSNKSRGSLHSSSTDDTSSDVTQDIYANSNPWKQGRRKCQKPNKLPFEPFMMPPINPFMMPPPMFMNSMQSGPFNPAGPFHTDGTYPNGTGRKFKDLSDDTLSSMLMAWYMAGYHTGYYQGLNSASPRRNQVKK